MARLIRNIVAGAAGAAMLVAGLVATPTIASAETAVRADGSFEVADNWKQRGKHWKGNRGWQGNRNVYNPRRAYAPRPGYYPRAAYRHPGWRGPGYYGRPGYSGRYYYNNYNSALAAGVFGLATGAIIAGAIANNNQATANNYIAYCSQRYRSFNPATGTYTGYDGLQHRCVMQ